jgi:hypothetical protein
LVLKNKSMKKILLLILLLNGCLESNAQLISKEVIKKYSPGTIARLYDMAKTITLTEAQQIALAEQFEIANSLLVNDLKEGKTQREIDSAQQRTQIPIGMILGKDMLTLSSKKAEGFARAASLGEVKYMQDTYNLDTGLVAKIRILQFNKYKRFAQQYFLYGFNERVASEKIAAASKQFDSLSFTIYPTLHSGKYLDNYLTGVKQVKPSIPDSTIRKIQAIFFASTAKNVYIDCGQTMLDIMQHLYPDTAITAHFYRPVIERQAKFLSSAERDFLLHDQHVSKSGLDTIYQLVLKKNYQQALLEYTYGANSIFRDSVIKASNKQYTSLIRAALFRDGSLLATNQFTIALKYKKTLELRPSLTDTLLWHAMYLDNRQDSFKTRDPFAKTDFKAYEAQWLNKLLTEEQYTKLLAIKNASAARLDAEEDWQDMETWNITKGFDKETTLKELYKYYLAKWIAYYRLANDKLKQEANQRAIKEMQPKALKMLSAAKKLPNPVNDNTNLQLKW